LIRLMLVSESLQVLIRFCSKCSSGENPSRTSKLPAGGVVLLVLVGLLAAALIIIYRLCEFILINFSWILLYQMSAEKLQSEVHKNMITFIYLCSDLFEGETFLKCEAGWEKHGGNCYYFSTSKSSWINSRRSCADHGSDLVKIDSREDRLRGLMVEDDDKFWIGLTDSVEEGRWFWVDGSPLDESLSFWSQNEPDDWKGENPAGEDCVRMGERGGSHDLTCWFDKACNVSLKSICEKPAAPGRPCV
uniref:C-type lectin domain-containing protein n=1 Tax=Xiphophorus maculatus TaxID=8083 RepID=A0A3B5RDX7_XIPMA